MTPEEFQVIKEQYLLKQQEAAAIRARNLAEQKKREDAAAQREAWQKKMGTYKAPPRHISCLKRYARWDAGQKNLERTGQKAPLFFIADVDPDIKTVYLDEEGE